MEEMHTVEERKKSRGETPEIIFFWVEEQQSYDQITNSDVNVAICASTVSFRFRKSYHQL